MYVPDYFTLTQIIIDDVYFPDGSCRLNQLGGGAYNVAGMRFWSDRVAICSGIGTDFVGNYDGWFINNDVFVAGVEREALCTHARINYFPDGEREEILIPGHGSHRLMQAEFHEIPESFSNCKGMYLFKDTEEAFWRDARQYFGSRRMRTVWEILGSDAVFEKRDAVSDCLSTVDMFSLNLTEGRRLTAKDSPKDIVKALHDLHAGTVLLRMGEHGSLASDGKRLYHFPAAETTVVDVTGGGNASTGGFLTGWCESGGDIVRAGVCAGVSAAFIIAQYSLPPSIDAEMQKRAANEAERLASRVERL